MYIFCIRFFFSYCLFQVILMIIIIFLPFFSTLILLLIYILVLLYFLPFLFASSLLIISLSLLLFFSSPLLLFSSSFLCSKIYHEIDHCSHSVIILYSRRYPYKFIQ